MNNASMTASRTLPWRQIDGHTPNLLGVFADRAVRRKPSHPGGVEYRGAPPSGLAIERIHGALRRPIGVEIRRHHEVVIVEQRLDQRAKSLDVAGRKCAAFDARN